MDNKNSRDDVFHHAYQSHLPALQSFIYRMTANKQDSEDLAQETFSTAYEKYSSFKGDSSFKTWIFAIAGHKVIDDLRTRKRWPQNIMELSKIEAMASQKTIEELAYIKNTSPHGQFEIKEYIDFWATHLRRDKPDMTSLPDALVDEVNSRPVPQPIQTNPDFVLQTIVRLLLFHLSE